MVLSEESTIVNCVERELFQKQLQQYLKYLQDLHLTSNIQD